MRVVLAFSRSDTVACIRIETSSARRIRPVVEVGRGSAIDQEIAAGDEAAFRPHDQRRQRSRLRRKRRRPPTTADADLNPPRLSTLPKRRHTRPLA